MTKPAVSKHGDMV